MPVLDYGHLSAPGGTTLAQYAVRAVMAWPDPKDEERRREYLATLVSMHLARLAEAQETLPDPLAAKGWEETILAIEQHEAWMASHDEIGQWFEKAGGHATVGAAPGWSFFEQGMRKRVSGWFAAGLILALVRRMATHHADLRGGASVNKAVHILDRMKPPMIPHNTNALRKAWATYKPVAHFCAALFDWFIIAGEHNGSPDKVAAALERELNENFMMFLAEAEAYLEFGLAHQPLRANGQTLLNPEETWVLPQYRPWPESPFEPMPLSGAMLEAVLDYRAPTPGA